MFIRLSFIAVFFAILIIPVTGLVGDFNIGKPVEAGKSKYPEFNFNFNSKQHKLQYFINAESWFNKNHALEGFYIRVFNEIQFLFGQSKELIFGKDDWYADKPTVGFIQKINSFTEEEIQAIVERIKRFQYYLAKRDIYFLITVIPLKTTVYPEKFPQIKQFPYTGFERIQKAFKLNGIPSVDVLKTMRNAPYVTHYKTDVHFNPYGAYLTSQKMLEHLYKKFNLTKPNEKPNINFKVYQTGAANTAMPKILPFKESHRNVSIASKAKIELYLINEVKEKFEGYNMLSSKTPLLPKTIMFGNSFMLLYKKTGFHNHFKKITEVLDYTVFRHVLDYLEKDLSIFILNVYESQLWFHVNPKQDYGYWDKRIYGLPLPDGYKYVPSS